MAKILAVDDELKTRELLYEAFHQKGHDVETAVNAGQALSVISKQTFDLIILDNSMPGESGVSLLKKIRASQNKVPVVIYSGHITAQIEKEARAEGANEVLSKDLKLDILSDRIEKILKAQGKTSEVSRSKKDKLLLIVDDEQGIREMLMKFFGSRSYRMLEARNGEEAVQLVRLQRPTIALLDMHMTGMDGLTTLKKLLEIHPELGVVMATGDANDQMLKQAMELGAYGYVLKPFDFLYLELVVMSKFAIAED